MCSFDFYCQKLNFFEVFLTAACAPLAVLKISVPTRSVGLEESVRSEDCFFKIKRLRSSRKLLKAV